MIEDKNQQRTPLSDLGEFALINHLTKAFKINPGFCPLRFQVKHAAAFLFQQIGQQNRKRDLFELPFIGIEG